MNDDSHDKLDECDDGLDSILQRNARVRLSKRALEILERHNASGISQNQLVENALIIAERTLGYSTVTLSDLTGVMMTHRAAVKDLSLCILETYELLTDVELLMENQLLLQPLEEDLSKFREKQHR